MIIVLGTIAVDADDRQAYLDGKAAQVRATLAEPGCLDYAFSADAGDPSRVRLVERWASMGDLEAHVTALRDSPAPAVAPVPSRMLAADVLEAHEVPAPWA